MKKQKEEVEAPSAPFWMVTYSDMVTLLLVFFILILSYSTIELEKFKGAMSSMKGALGVMPEMESSSKKEKMNIQERLTTKEMTLKQKINRLEEIIEENQLTESIEIELTASGVHIRLGDNVLFDLGKAEIRPSAYPVLSGIAETVRGDFREIYVEGHTDNIPIHTPRFPSNWELSSARALSVVRYLHDREGIPAGHLAAVGHGEHRPLVPNDSPINRARNRRVEIFIKWE